MKKNTITYESALAELEQILATIENGGVAIDNIAKMLKHAQELLTFCKKQLAQVEEEVNGLLEEDNSEL